MGRYTGPKHKLARREGINILEKTSTSLDRRINILPGAHGKMRRRKHSDYAVQLREKQKLKRIYGLMEKQFKKYINLAQKKKGNTEVSLVRILETRLDNIVYRLGFGKSRFMARQLVSHGHILVNGKKLNIPSYNVKIGDTISFTPKLLKNEIFKSIATEEENKPLPFLEKKDSQGKLLRLPESSEVPNPVDYQLVVEFYSR